MSSFLNNSYVLNFEEELQPPPTAVFDYDLGIQSKDGNTGALETATILEIIIGCLLAIAVVVVIVFTIVRKAGCCSGRGRSASDEYAETKQKWTSLREDYNTIEREKDRRKSRIASWSAAMKRASAKMRLTRAGKSDEDGRKLDGKARARSEDYSQTALSRRSTTQYPPQHSPAVTHSLRHGSIPFMLPPTGIGGKFPYNAHNGVERVQPSIPASSSISSTTSTTEAPSSPLTDEAFHSSNDNSYSAFDSAFIFSDESGGLSSPETRLKSSGQFRDSLLGQIQPELYRFSEHEEHDMPPSQYGRIWFTLVYDAAVEALTVKVIKVRQLPGRGSNVPHDSFIKLFLLPDERMSQQTKVQRRTNNPRFNETIVFQVSEKDVRERTLRLSVYDVDKRKVARHLLGHALVTLSDVELLSQGEDVMWRDLNEIAHPGDSGSSLGEMNISLSYLPTMSRLTIVVLRARNLREIDLEETGVYVKVALKHGHQVVKTRKTAVKRGVCDPNYNESFAFTVTSKDIESSCLYISVITMGYHSGISQITSSVKNLVRTGKPTNEHKYGRIVVGSFMFCRGEQLLHWQEMLAQPRKTIVKWHPLSEVTPNN